MGANKKMTEMRMLKKINPCPKCGKKVEARRNEDKYRIHCECGLIFQRAMSDYCEFADAWNRLAKQVGD